MKKLICISVLSALLSACTVPPKPIQPSGKRVLINPDFVVEQNRTPKQNIQLVEDKSE